MLCEKWLEEYIKHHEPVDPKTVYAAGKEKGFSRAEIKKARHWHGKCIDTEMPDGNTLWRWNW